MDYIDLEKIKFYKNANEFFTKNRKQRIILMTTKAKKIYTDFKFRKKDTLLFGRESAGVPEKIHKKVNFRLKIPMENKTRSLNLSTSVSIVLSENLRQTKYL